MDNPEHFVPFSLVSSHAPFVLTPLPSHGVCPDVHFPSLPYSFSLLHFPPVSLPLSSLTTSDLISHFLTPSLPYSISFRLSLPPSLSLSAISVGVKRISQTKRGSKALNDGIEIWQNKFGLLTPSEKLSLRQSRF